MSLLRRMLRATEWGQLLDFVSPAFFEVLPPRALASATRALVASTRDARGFEAVAARIGAALAERGAPVAVALEEPFAGRPPSRRGAREARAARGQLVLRLYFEQLLHADAALLDLRGARFAVRDGALTWWPSRGFVRWDPDFLAALRAIYRGFYAGDDAGFHAGLEALGLDGAADLFLEHFGAGDQRAVSFAMDHFTRSFHGVFVRCREDGVRLHPDFVALGVHLAALYEHLEPLGVPLDVRAAFAAASA